MGGALALNFGLRLGRGNHPPHFVEGVHVKGQVVQFALIIGHRAVGIAVEHRKPVHIIPHLFVVGVKNMCAVAMHLNALDFFGINIARNVAALVNYKALFARLGGFVGKHSAVQPGANDQIIIHGLFMHSFCARPKPKQVFVFITRLL